MVRRERRIAGRGLWPLGTWRRHRLGGGLREAAVSVVAGYRRAPDAGAGGVSRRDARADHCALPRARYAPLHAGAPPAAQPARPAAAWRAARRARRQRHAACRRLRAAAAWSPGEAPPPDPGPRTGWRARAAAAQTLVEVWPP